MTPQLSPDLKEIINLLSLLKAETPEYPVDMLAARKAAFLKHAATINIQVKGQGGEGGQNSGGGGPGSALGGSTTAQGIAFQALIGLGLVASMLVGAYLFRNQVTGLLDENYVVTTEQSPESAVLPLTNDIATPPILPTESVPTVATLEVPSSIIESTPTVDDIMRGNPHNNELLDTTKTNPGLHLGQTPGAPAAPGQGNPGNINRPDKPDKPEKPDKERPERPESPRGPDR